MIQRIHSVVSFLIIAMPISIQAVAAESAARSKPAEPPASSPATAPAQAVNTGPIHTGYAGHFACRAFAGIDREFCIAASERDRQQAAWSLQDGANVNARAKGLIPPGMTILHVAIWYHWPAESVQILLDSGAKVNLPDAHGNRPLIYACRDHASPDPALVKALLDRGARVDDRGEQHMSPLMFAAIYSNSPEIIEILLKAGADVRAADRNGWTALMHATRADNDPIKIVAQLLAAGADVKRTHHRGGTALLSACLSGHRATAQRLLQAGATINAVDDAGWSPLAGAVLSQDERLVRLLLDAGADPNLRDRLGRTALELASLTGNRAILGQLTPIDNVSHP